MVIDPSNVNTAAQVCTRFAASAEARGLLASHPAPEGFAAALLEQKLYKDAVPFVACCLEKRHAVWWGCLCAWHALGSHLDSTETAALGAAVRWVLDPKPESRKAAASAGEAAGGTTTSLGALALATGWSDGSMAPPGLPEVKPPEFLTQKVVGAAVIGLAARSQPGDPASACRAFVTLAWDVAQGRIRWES